MYKSVTTLLKEIRAPKMSAKQRKDAQKVVNKILESTYFDTIPLNEIMEGLKKVGIVVLQEDNTEWAGMLLGSNAHTTFTLGPLSSARKENYGIVYDSFSNSMLVLSWYKDVQRKTRKTEVTGYIS